MSPSFGGGEFEATLSYKTLGEDKYQSDNNFGSRFHWYILPLKSGDTITLALTPSKEGDTFSPQTISLFYYRMTNRKILFAFYLSIKLLKFISKLSLILVMLL